MNIKRGDFKILEETIYSEETLSKIAENILRSKNKDRIIFNLIENIPWRNHNYDWNIGSLLQHFKSDDVINEFKKFDTIARFYNSIGLAWVFGEFEVSDRDVTEYLYGVVCNSSNSDAWWRAAFSIEKIGLDEAVNLLKRSLKRNKILSLEEYLVNINDKRSVIGILVLCNIDNIEKKIFPSIKDVFLTTDDVQTLNNCCWLIGRLKLIDQDIHQRLLELVKHSNYEIKYYTFFALEGNADELMRDTMEKALSEKDPLIRKMAARSLLNIGNEKSLPVLEKALLKESSDKVVSEISHSIHTLINPTNRKKLYIAIKSYKNENGMIIDESDKWYADPSIYHYFSEAEDPENICFNLIMRQIGDRRIINPIDIATGTGRMAWQILTKIDYNGSLFVLDNSEKMCEFVKKNIKRERKYTRKISIIQSATANASKAIKVKSNFIISCFGFPSKISNKTICMKELKSIYNLLSDDGYFYTIGWDERFNDELSRIWFKYIPDNICAKDFEEWRAKRSSRIQSPRNCGLKWFKRGIEVPLQFSSLSESAYTMGYLFGRDAAQYVVKNEKTEWTMSLGITCNSKKELKAIINQYEKRNRNFGRSSRQ